MPAISVMRLRGPGWAVMISVRPTHSCFETRCYASLLSMRSYCKPGGEEAQSAVSNHEWARRREYEDRDDADQSLRRHPRARPLLHHRLGTCASARARSRDRCGAEARDPGAA